MAQGALEYAAANKAGFSELAGRVASKGGTTEAALKEWKKAKLGQIVLKGVKAAYKRSKQLSK